MNLLQRLLEQINPPKNKLNLRFGGDKRRPDRIDLEKKLNQVGGDIEYTPLPVYINRPHPGVGPKRTFTTAPMPQVRFPQNIAQPNVPRLYEDDPGWASTPFIGDREIPAIVRPKVNYGPQYQDTSRIRPHRNFY